MIRRFRRLSQGVAVAAVTAMAGSLALVASSTPPSGAATPAVSRVAGATRFGTAAALATQAFPGGAATALIATGFNFPDALAGNYLAGQDGAPILLTNKDVPSGGVPSETLQALQTLKTKNVIILGLQAAVGNDIQSQLASTQSSASGGGNLNVTRIGGATRLDTAQLINETPGASAVGVFQSKKTALLARSDNFPDALGAGPVAYAEKFPVILTDPNTLSPQASKTISDLGIQQVIVLGGPAAISAATEQQANAAGAATLFRANGISRSDTSRLLADFAITNFGFRNNKVIIASGAQQFGGADALASGPFAAAQGSAGTASAGQARFAQTATSTSTSTTTAGGSGSGSPVPLLVTDSVDCSTGAGKIITFETTDNPSSTIIAVGGSFPLPQCVLDAITAAATGSNTTNTATTNLPTLLSASITGTTTVGQSNGTTNPAGTTIQYVFSQDVSQATLKPGGFFAYDFTDGKFTAASVVPDKNPNKTSGNPMAIDALFSATMPTSGGTMPNENLQTTAGANNLTLATVGGPQDTGGPAVVLPVGANPDGSAPIGSSTSGTASGPGVTAAPNPESFAATGTANATMFPNSTAVNVLFDKAAFTQTSATPATTPPTSTGFSVVFVTSPAVGAGGTGNEAACSGPGPSDITSAAGGTVPGGNGTTTLTIVCPDGPTGANMPSTTTLTTAGIARIFVAAATVGTGQTGTSASANVSNPPEATDSPRPQSDSPDLTAVAFIPGTTSSGTGSSGTADQIVYTFDQPLVTGSGVPPTGGPTAIMFGFNRADGSFVRCVAATSPSTTTAPFTAPCTAAVNTAGPNPPANGNTQVVVTVGKAAGTGPSTGPPPTAGGPPTGAGETAGATGAFALAGAVTGANATPPTNTPKTNGDDEFAGSNPNNSATQVAPGTVAAPQLTAVKISTTTNAAGTTTAAVYTFSQPVTAPAAASFHLYDADGTELTCSGTATVGSVSATNNQVTCSTFNQVTSSGGSGSAATNTQLQNTVLGTADANAVTGSTTNGSPNTNTNPEGGVNSTKS